MRTYSLWRTSPWTLQAIMRLLGDITKEAHYSWKERPCCLEDQHLVGKRKVLSTTSLLSDERRACGPSQPPIYNTRSHTQTSLRYIKTKRSHPVCKKRWAPVRCWGFLLILEAFNTAGAKANRLNFVNEHRLGDCDWTSAEKRFLTESVL